MPGDVTIRGGAGLARLANDLFEVGGKRLRSDAGKVLRLKAKPLSEAARAAARAQLPKSGGLGEWVAAATISPSVRLAGRNPSIRLVGKKKGHDLDAIDRGFVRHRVFGRNVWVTQQVPPGWWTETLQRESEQVLRGLVAALNEIGADLNRRRY